MQIIRYLICLLVVGLILPLTFIQAAAAVSFNITLLDPAEEMTLGSDEQLYINISYMSDEPVRFLASALRNGEIRDVGAIMSSAGLHSAGKSDALIWIAFANPTHIDEVIVTAYNEQWDRLASVSAATSTHWSGELVEPPRVPAEWVLSLQKKERLKRDYLFDPEPNRPEPVSDVIFILAILSIPVYITLQIRMLRRYKLRWRELSTVPLITALPLVVYAFWVGIGFNLRLWPPFFLYFMLVSCIYLLTLWLVKRVKS